MKLTLQPLQFWPTANPNEVTTVLPTKIRFLRLRHEGVEIFYYDPIGNDRIARIDGTCLADLWRRLLFNLAHAFRPGAAESGLITAVFPRERRSALLQNPLAPVVMKCRADCFTIETGTVCDVWSNDDLEAFAIHRYRPELLLQFHGFAYVLTPREGQFEAVRDRMLADNLSTRNCPLYTVWNAEKRPANYDGRFHAFKTIAVFERTLAANGDWNVLLRPNPPRQRLSGPGMDI